MVSGNQNDQPIEGWIQNHVRNQSKKLKLQADPICMSFIKATHNVSQYFMYGPHMLVCTPDVWYVVYQRISYQAWIRVSVSSWSVCWQLRILWYIMSQRFSTGFRSGEHEDQSMASMPSSARRLLASTWRSVRPSKIILPTPSETYCQTGHAGLLQAAWCSPQHLQTLSHLTHVNLLSSVKRMGRQCWTCQFSCSLANANRAARCWAVSTGPTTGRQALMPPSWSLFLTVWSVTCTPVACWR